MKGLYEYYRGQQVLPTFADFQGAALRFENEADDVSGLAAREHIGDDLPHPPYRQLLPPARYARP